MHFGTKGMRWGFRHQPSRLGKTINKFKKKRAREKKYYKDQSKIKGTWQYHEKAALHNKRSAIALLATATTIAGVRKLAAKYNHPAEEWLASAPQGATIAAVISAGLYNYHTTRANAIRNDRISRGKKVW